MSKYTLIISELKKINPAKFQVICDLYLMHEYKGDIHSIGTATGTEKTRKGKPDTYIITPSGKYILCEYIIKDSVKKSAFIKKLEKDLTDCFKLESLNIKAEQVETIILGCNSRLEVKENEYLIELSKANGFRLRIVNIDTLAVFLNFRGRIIAKDQLGIPFDTGQVLNKEQFLKYYHRRNIATPLDNQVFGRDEYVNQIVGSIIKNNITILKGAPGVGKSRLAIKAIDNFLTKYDSYESLYIVQQNNSIAEDLSIHLGNKNYILFIDDANRQIDNLLAVLTQQLDREAFKIKIVITVRDYAINDVLEKCKELGPNAINVGKLSADTIEQILRSSDFNLTDQQYIDRINQVCDGNPRLAIMAAKVIKESNNIKALHDVSSIYEEYYNSFTKDKALFKDKKALKALGLLSFFNTIDMKSEEGINSLRIFGITQSDFVDSITMLEDIEIVDVYMKDVAKISEQVLSTYFFYKIFIVDKLLNFSILLSKYLQSRAYRTKDCIYPCETAFGRQNILDNVGKDLSNYWELVKSEEQEATTYLEVFGRYFSNQVFPFIEAKIQQLPVASEDEIKYDQYVRGYTGFNSPVNLLEPFFKSYIKTELVISIELAIDYTARVPHLYERVLKALETDLEITDEDVNTLLARQEIAFKVFASKLHASKICRHLYYHVHEKVLLGVYIIPKLYQQNNPGRWEFIKPFQNLRKQMWDGIIDHYDKYPDIIEKVLTNYLDNIQDRHYIHLKFDYQFLLKLLESRFSNIKFSDCIIAQEYFDKIKDFDFAKDLQSATERFVSPTYSISKILSPKRFWSQEVHNKFRSQEEIENYKLSEINAAISIGSLNDFEIIYQNIAEIVVSPLAIKFNLYPMIDQLIGAVLIKDIKLGFETLEFYITNGNIGKIYPATIYRIIFKAESYWCEKLYSLIEHYEYDNKRKWIEAYFDYIPENLIDQSIVDKMVNLLEKQDQKIEISSNKFKKFVATEPDIEYNILQLAILKYEKNNDCKYEIAYDFFQKNTNLVAEHRELCKKAYLQQFQITSTYDFDCSELMILFKPDHDFIFVFVDTLISLNQQSYSRYYRDLSFLWHSEDGENIVYKCLVKFMNLRSYSSYDHIGTIFFRDLKSPILEKAIQLLKRFSADFFDNLSAANLVLDITRNSLPIYYPEMMQHILRNNNDIKFFIKLQLHNNHFSSTSETTVWSDFKAAELRRLYEAINELEDIRNYILHLEYLEKLIGYEENESNREKKLRYMGLR